VRPAPLALPELDKRHADLRLVWRPFWHPAAQQSVQLIAQSVIHEIRVGVIAEAERHASVPAVPVTPRGKTRVAADHHLSERPPHPQ